MSSIVNPHVFREYDIRGEAERDLPDEMVRDLGRALGTFWTRRGGRRVSVGRDCRLSSPRLFAALTEGLLETGVRVIDLGVVPTPLMYFSVFAWDLDGGVQITGSHNPPEDNGFKMMAGRATMSGEDIQALGAFVRRRDFTRAPGGTIVEADVLPEYVGFVEGNVRLARGDLRVAIDAGNGAA
ncbi:MAG: phosphomannomutase, partial [Myxococcales bacterium]|nr:phosphomannomutase [Myxococcales bacterium]